MLYDACPDCGDEQVVATFEDEGILYQCQSCDWMTVADIAFCPGAWGVRIRQALAPVDILESMLASEGAASFLRPRLKGISYLANYESWRPRAPEGEDDYLLGELAIARDVYLRQMIVLAATNVELILTNFFHCVYITNPQRMNQVLPPHGKRGAAIRLSEVIEAGSREELLSKLADQAASLKGGGESDKIVKRLIDECHIELHRPIVDDLKALKELRNRIVHDYTEEAVTLEQVHSAFSMILYLLYVLAQATETYAWACWDDTGFVYDCEERLRNEKSTE